MRKKMTSKVMAVALTAAMAMGLAACSNGNGGEAEKTDVTPETKEEVAEEKTEEVAPVEEEVSPYTIRTDANGNTVDLGGMKIVLKDWWSDPEATPNNEYEQAQADYREWAMETYNFEMVQSGDYGWGDCIEKLVEYAQAPATDEYALFTVRPDPSLSAAFAKGQAYDLGSLDCLDLASEKYAQNDITTLCTYKGKIYGMSAGVSEPRDGFFFNKKLLEDGGHSADEIYDMQKNGTWTWDAFEAICKDVAKDLDNDSVNDIWAWSGNTGSFVTDMIFANGGQLVGSTDAGYTYNVEDQNTVDALNKANDLIRDYRMKDPQVENAETGALENAPWDYFYTAFKNGDCVFMFDGAYAGYANGQIGDITDFEIGFVMCPKGPEGELVTARVNNPVVIPGNYDADTAWKIAFAFDVWNDAPAGYEGYNGFISNCRSGIFDERACDETIPLMASVGHGFVNFASMVPELDVNNGFIWSVNGEATISELIESKREYFQTTIDAAN